MTCRFSVWPVLLQADLFHTMTWAGLRDTRRAFLCFRFFLESEARSCSGQVMMTPWLHCELLPADQEAAWWARVKYHAWAPVQNMGNYFPPWSCFLPLLRNQAGIPNHGQAALHPSPSPWSQPGKERKVETRLCRRRSFREVIQGTSYSRKMIKAGVFIGESFWRGWCYLLQYEQALVSLLQTPDQCHSHWGATEAERVCRNRKD